MLPCTVWRAVPPPSFVAVGCIITLTHNKPSPGSYHHHLLFAWVLCGVPTELTVSANQTVWSACMKAWWCLPRWTPCCGQPPQALRLPLRLTVRTPPSNDQSSINSFDRFII
jgi:hypothetical protein